MIIVDTGYLLALADAADAHHQHALSYTHTLSEGWVTTWPVLTEVINLITSHLHQDAATPILEDVERGVLAVWDIPTTRIGAMLTLMRKYRKLPMDLADASLVLLAEQLGEGRILTTDSRDFGAYRWKSRQPFVDLMALGR